MNRDLAQCLREWKPRKYWKPEPKLHDLAYWCLLLPAIVYVVGVILYGAEAMKAGLITALNQGYGSTLMVIGGEAGTLATVHEVFRKYRERRIVTDRRGRERTVNETNPLDWLGLLVSLVATLGTLFVVFARQTAIDSAWVTFAQTYGPLVLLLCSGLDFYATGMEAGFYRSSFSERWRKWNDGRHVFEQRERNKFVEMWQESREELRITQPELEVAQSEPQATQPEPQIAQESQTEMKAAPILREFVGGIGAWRELAAKLNGSGANLTGKQINEVLIERGFAPVADSTARYWARMTRIVQPGAE